METLNFRVPGGPLGGFASHYRERYVGRRSVHGPYDLLNGLSGIGLALLGAVAETPPTWDEVLCVNLPAPAQRAAGPAF